jgi:hypothetical protein
MDQASHEIRRFRRRVAHRVAVVRGLRWGAVYLVAWGTVALLLRAAFSVSSGWLLMGLGGLVPVAALAVLSGLRSRPDPLAVRARLDREGAAGGLLMAAAEVDLGAWSQRLPPLLPGPRLVPTWRPGRTAGAGLGAAAYLAACLLLPVTRAGEAPPRPLDLRREVAARTEELAKLEEAGVLEEERADTLREELAAVAENAAGDRPAESWEALEALQRQTAALVAEAAENALAESDALALAGELAAALATAAENGAEVTAAAQELAELSGQAAAEQGRMAAFSDLLASSTASTGSPGKPGKPGEPGETGAWTPERLERLAEGLANDSAEALERLRKLAAAGRLPPGIDGELMRRAAQQAAGQGEADSALRAFLEENAGSSLAETLAACNASGACRLGRPGDGPQPGQGGISRGPGPAPMTWKDPTAEGGARFAAVALPPAAVAALGRQSLLGLSVADPTTPGAAPPSGSEPPGAAALPAGEGSAVVRELLPQHRGAVRRYFERAPQETPRE